MGLDRTKRVLAQMGLSQPNVPVITVAGTNGKGSTVAYLQSIFAAANLRCGTTTSPHVFDVNERVCIGGEPIADRDLVECMHAVELGRGDIPLTYFEFLIVAAMFWFREKAVDVIVLEVGLGGRLDATNCIDSDIAIVTSIGVDHVAWLGSDPLRIAEEKAAICRAQRPLVLADKSIPSTADALAQAVGAHVYRESEGYLVERVGAGLKVRVAGDTLSVDRCGIATVPVTNAAAAIMAAKLLQPRLNCSNAAIVNGIQHASLIGRGQTLDVIWKGKPVSLFLDVAHNPASASVLSRYLKEQTASDGRKPVALCAMLADKDCKSVYQALYGDIAAWHLAGLQSQRGQAAEQLAEAMGNPPACLHYSVEDALPLALDKLLADNHQSLVVFGSFETVSAALTWCDKNNEASL